MRILLLLIAAAGLSACGGGPTPKPASDFEDDAVRVVEYESTLHQFVILTANPKAMQTDADREAMWAAVNGTDPQHSWIAPYVKQLPPGYKANITLDFADLPHEAFPAKRLELLIKGLSKVQQAKARNARLAIFVRGDLVGLPGAAQVRLAGVGVQQIAAAHDAVIIDLLARRAWTRDAWLAEIKARQLGPNQIRLGAAKKGKGVWLFSRGNAKFGEPDLLIRDVPPSKLAQAKARFKTVHAALLSRAGGRVAGESAQMIAGETLLPCTAPPAFFDAGCVQIAP
ncbi:MAG: hypothetical protein ACI9U2_002956 [Bradymonadia bacterium]|jgi:hypothetical protein